MVKKILFAKGEIVTTKHIFCRCKLQFIWSVCIEPRYNCLQDTIQMALHLNQGSSRLVHHTVISLNPRSRPQITGLSSWDPSVYIFKCLLTAKRKAEVLTPRMSECDLIWNSHCQCNWLRCSHTGVEWAPNPTGLVPLAVWRWTQGKGHIANRADRSYAAAEQEHQILQENQQAVRRGMEGLLHISEGVVLPTS